MNNIDDWEFYYEDGNKARNKAILNSIHGLNVKGAEHCKAWERREWLKTLAIPEHSLLWTLIVCPIAGLAVAGICALLG